MMYVYILATCLSADTHAISPPDLKAAYEPVSISMYLKLERAGFVHKPMYTRIVQLKLLGLVYVRVSVSIF